MIYYDCIIMFVLSVKYPDHPKTFPCAESMSSKPVVRCAGSCFGITLVCTFDHHWLTALWLATKSHPLLLYKQILQNLAASTVFMPTHRRLLLEKGWPRMEIGWFFSMVLQNQWWNCVRLHTNCITPLKEMPRITVVNSVQAAVRRIRSDCRANWSK